MDRIEKKDLYICTAWLVSNIFIANDKPVMGFLALIIMTAFIII